MLLLLVHQSNRGPTGNRLWQALLHHLVTPAILLLSLLLLLVLAPNMP
jgi:hypothetical protein